MNISKLSVSLLSKYIIMLSISILSYSQEVIVPKITQTKFSIGLIYKDTLVGGRSGTRDLVGYNRQDAILWENTVFKDTFHNPTLGLVDNQGNHYIHSGDGDFNYSILDVKYGVFKKPPVIRYVAGIYEAMTVSNKDYIYSVDSIERNYFISKINMENRKILNTPLKEKCNYPHDAFIDIDENILFASAKCLIKIDQSGEIIVFHKNIESPNFEITPLIIQAILPNGNLIASGIDLNYLVAIDKNFNRLWEHDTKGSINNIVIDKNNNFAYLDTSNTLYYKKEDSTTIWEIKLEGSNAYPRVGFGLLLSDNATIYAYYTTQDSEITSAINNKGKLIWKLRAESITDNSLILDQTGVLYKPHYKIQTSSKGLLRGGWPMKKHDPRRTNNATSPIYLKEYPNNNDHKKVICEVDNKTIDINKLTHLSKGWHLLGNSYETKDYCPFSNIDYVYYYDTSNNKFNKININDESTHKVIPKHSGLFIYNKYDDNLTIYYNKEEVLEKDKNIINKEYINTLSNGWHLLGSSDSINDISIFEDIKDVYVYDNTRGYALLGSEDGSNSIKEYSGFWVHK